MDCIQKILKDTEKDFNEYKNTNEKMRLSEIKRIDKQILHLEKKKERLELGFDDLESYY